MIAMMKGDLVAGMLSEVGSGLSPRREHLGTSILGS